MSSNYCVQLTQNITVLSMFTAKPINFTSLQFSLSVNSLVIFLFSKYPFNFGYANNFCINQDEFGFAQVGESFDIDLSNYQGYYMLILIYPQGINLRNVGACSIISNFTMTFQNTTISPIQKLTINLNFDSQTKTNFCTCYQGQSSTPGAYCSNYSLYSVILLENLNNYLIINTCQAFLIQNNTSVQFVTPYTCPFFGAIVSAQIFFIANQEVIDFLNSNNITYSIISSNTCQLSTILPLCTLPCKSILQITKLLNPPSKYSIISSKLWNEVVNDLYLAYSVYKYINYLSQFPYMQNMIYAIIDFYNFYENFQPYPFIPLIKAKKGLPLTTDYFNSLIDAIIELANMATIQLKRGISYVQPDEIVKSLKFDNIIYNVNQLLTFNYYQYFLLSCNGSEFNNLLNSISTFLNVLINNLQYYITIPSNVYIKNFLIYDVLNNMTVYGTIVNFILYKNHGSIGIWDNSYINSLILENNENNVYIGGNSNITTLEIGINTGNIAVQGNSVITTLNIKINTGNVQILDNAIVENLICDQNSGTVSIQSTATVINNYCTS